MHMIPIWIEITNLVRISSNDSIFKHLIYYTIILQLWLKKIKEIKLWRQVLNKLIIFID